jgi:O-antigen/teichoic acid export membrane protein
MKKIIFLMGGSTGSYIIGFLVFVVATKYLTKEEIGLYSVFLSFLAIASQFTSGKVELAIPMATVEDENKILSSVMITAFFISLTIGFIVAFIVPDYYLALLGRINYMVIALFLALSVFLNTMFGVMNIILIKKGELVFYGKMLIILSFLRAIGQLFSIFILKSLSSFIMFFILPFIFILKKSNIDFFNFFRSSKDSMFENYFYVYKKYKNKVFHIMPASILNSFTVYTVPLFIGYQYSLSIVGLYMLADKIVSVPFRIVSTAFESSFVHKISSEKSENIKLLIIRYIVAYSIMFLVGYMIIIMFIDSSYFIKVFNNDWLGVSLYVKYIAMLYALFFISSTISKVVTLSENTDIILKFDIMKLFVLLFIYIVTILLNFNIENFFLMYMLGMNLLAMYLIYKSYIFKGTA